MKTLLFLLLLSQSLAAFTQVSDVQCLQKVQLRSEALHDAREFWVGLPEGYDSSKTYPTVYVLDAETRFDITYALTKELFINHDKMPAVVVVGIPQIDWQHRKKDMTFTTSRIDGSGKPDNVNFLNPEEVGGGKAFLQHIEREIIPYVDAHYSTNGFNTLIGHSLGGYFCAYALPIQRSFAAMLIYDGSIWYNSGDAIQHLKQHTPKNVRSNVYVTQALYHYGPQSEIQYHLEQIDALSETLRSYPGIRMETKSYPKENHVSMYMYSVIDGLTFLFEGCEYGFISPTDQVTLASYRAHYAKTSERLGFTFSPPVDGIRWVGFANFSQRKWAEAILAYEACYSKYGNDIGVNKELAICHEKLGHAELHEKYSGKVRELLQK